MKNMQCKTWNEESSVTRAVWSGAYDVTRPQTSIRLVIRNKKKNQPRRHRGDTEACPPARAATRNGPSGIHNEEFNSPGVPRSAAPDRRVSLCALCVSVANSSSEVFVGPRPLVTPLPGTTGCCETRGRKVVPRRPHGSKTRPRTAHPWHGFLTRVNDPRTGELRVT